MAADPVVKITRHVLSTDVSRKVFPYDVFIPTFDEPDVLIDELMAHAPKVLNAESIYLVRNGGDIKATHAIIGKTASTRMVLVLDADLKLDDGPFKFFPTELFVDEFEFVHLWNVRNPANGLVYGHGGPKLFNREHLSHAVVSPGVDMTTSIGRGLTLYEECVGTHAFNWSPFSAWRTAVREAVKLHDVAHNNHTDAGNEASKRLHIWTTEADPGAAYSEFCKEGALMGVQLARELDYRHWINDYSRLAEIFKQKYPDEPT